VVKRLLSIPPDPDPPAGCVQINVPDDKYWRSLFYGALDQLTLWNSYEHDAGHSGKAVADKWRSIISAAHGSSCVGQPWCAHYDFTGSDYGDVWEVVPIGSSIQSNPGTYTPGVGYSVSATAVGALNVFLALHFASSFPIQVDYVEITWEGGSTVNVANTVGVAADEIQSDGNHGWTENTSAKGLNSVVRGITPVHSKFATDHYVEVQLVNDGNQSSSGILVIYDVKLFGSATPPDGVPVCD